MCSTNHCAMISAIATAATRASRETTRAPRSRLCRQGSLADGEAVATSLPPLSSHGRCRGQDKVEHVTSIGHRTDSLVLNRRNGSSTHSYPTLDPFCRKVPRTIHCTGRSCFVKQPQPHPGPPRQGSDWGEGPCRGGP